jgi:hypothetical protein
VGQWAGPWFWSPSTEFGHAVLLLTGPHAGKLLIWNAPTSLVPQIFDPINPQNLTPTGGTSTPANIFCASHTQRKDGTILVCGGIPVPAPTPPGYTCTTDWPLPPDGTAPGWNPANNVIPAACFPCSEIREVWRFDPVTVTWTQLPSMNQSRYYPTQTAVPGGLLPNLDAGDPIVIAGTQDQYCGVHHPAHWWQTSNDNRRIVDGGYLRGFEHPHVTTGAFIQTGSGAGPVGWPGWQQGVNPNPPYFRFFPHVLLLTSEPATLLICGDTHPQFYYGAPPSPLPPSTSSFRHYQTPNAMQATYKLDIATGTFTLVAVNQDRYYGSVVILIPLSGVNRVLRFGGSTGPKNQSYPIGNAFAAFPHSVEEWDDATSTWVPRAPLAFPRVFQNAVVLPTGEILILGGSDTDYQNSPGLAAAPRFVPELYDPGLAATPGTGSTTVVAPHACPRVYHSVGALLHDGRVALLGGQNVQPIPPNLPSAWSAEIYSPPYLFQPGGRPKILSVTPPAPAYGGNLTVTVNWASGREPTLPIETKFVLMRPASATHHVDFDQRWVELASSGHATPGGTQTMTVTMPPSQRHAPPGHYMLFALQRPVSMTTLRDWVPSVAAFVKL